jgi:hypothetical protein
VLWAIPEAEVIMQKTRSRMRMVFSSSPNLKPVAKAKRVLGLIFIRISN